VVLFSVAMCCVDVEVLQESSEARWFLFVGTFEVLGMFSP
jgi:hypothetical protein